MITSRYMVAGVLIRFPILYPGDLSFDPKWPSFKHNLEIIKTNIYNKINDDGFINVILACFGFPLIWPVT